METPDYPLQFYYHSFSVDDEGSVLMAGQLLKKYGLLAIGKEYGAGNLTGNLLYSFRYLRRNETPIISAWSNKINFIKRNSKLAMEEYGIHNNLTPETKSFIKEEVVTLLQINPQNHFLQYFLENLRYLSKHLPANEFSWLMKFDQDVKSIFYNMVQDLLFGNDEIDDQELKSTHIKSLSAWFDRNPDSLIYNQELAKNNKLIDNIVTGVNRNMLVWELYQLTHFLDLEQSNKEANLTRSRKRLEKYYFLDRQNRLFIENLGINVGRRPEYL